MKLLIVALCFDGSLKGVSSCGSFCLGLLYKDDANQKRWVLKFNDAKTISQIDAVFVTVEPEGGSARPSGKPLLFTLLPFTLQLQFIRNGAQPTDRSSSHDAPE